MAKNMHGYKIKFDKEILAIAKEFLEHFMNIQIEEITAELDLQNILANNSWSFSNNKLYIFDDISQTFLHNLIINISKKLPAAVVNETFLNKVIKTFAQNHYSKIADCVSLSQKLIDEIISEISKPIKFIAPNYLFQLDDGIEELTIGPVTIVNNSLLKNLIGTNPYNKEIIVEINNELGIERTENTIKVNSTKVNWYIELNTAIDTCEEEAKWLINIAVSLYRFSIKEHRGYVATWGEIEPIPYTHNLNKDDHIKIEDGMPTGFTYFKPNFYLIETSSKIELEDPIFVNTAELIFSKKKDTIAERIANGLGWLTKARQTIDRAERLLLFFTAIEALLSNNDGTPITETISRYTSVILLNDNSERFILYQRMKEYYSLRSKIVHKGERNVLWNEVNYVQEIAESLFTRILHEVDLTKTFKEFLDSLKIATFGQAWNPKF